MDKSDLIKFGLEFSNIHLKDYTQECYNPLAKFIPYVTTKEIVHTSIISDLLSDNGEYGNGDSFIKNFFNIIGIEYAKFHDIKVIRERKVSRVLTNGGSRSIDICITCKDSQNNNHAIIIENKLNHAGYQELQIEDYVEAISKENLNVDKIVLLHDFKQSLIDNQYTGDKFIYLYPEKLFEWIEQSTSNPEILAYGKYIKSLNNNNIPKINAQIMKNLQLEDIQNLKKIADAYSNLAFELREDIVASVKNKLQQMDIVSTFGKLDEGWKGLQLWNWESYKKNGLWVVVFPPYDPADDEKGYDIYLYAKEENQSEATKVANKCDYELYGRPQEGYCFFRAKDGQYRFRMFPQENREKLISEVVRLLNQLKE
ncbi:MAG: PD-(D/E)XK nuclease family protein [Muribaculaceae bacterium]|nr:PD-(D/E)XK nuclease family protein [Muribaculaceae bacterium]